MNKIQFFINRIRVEIEESRMMESDVPSSYNVKIYRPTLNEFENSAELLAKIDIECHDDCFAKVSVFLVFVSNSSRFLTFLIENVEN